MARTPEEIARRWAEQDSQRAVRQERARERSNERRDRSNTAADLRQAAFAAVDETGHDLAGNAVSRAELAASRAIAASRDTVQQLGRATRDAAVRTGLAIRDGRPDVLRSIGVGTAVSLKATVYLAATTVYGAGMATNGIAKGLIWGVRQIPLVGKPTAKLLDFVRKGVEAAVRTPIRKSADGIEAVFGADARQRLALNIKHPGEALLTTLDSQGQRRLDAERIYNNEQIKTNPANDLAGQEWETTLIPKVTLDDDFSAPTTVIPTVSLDDNSTWQTTTFAGPDTGYINYDDPWATTDFAQPDFDGDYLSPPSPYLVDYDSPTVPIPLDDTLATLDIRSGAEFADSTPTTPFQPVSPEAKRQEFRDFVLAMTTEVSDRQTSPASFDVIQERQQADITSISEHAQLRQFSERSKIQLTKEWFDACDQINQSIQYRFGVNQHEASAVMESVFGTNLELGLANLKNNKELTADDKVAISALKDVAIHSTLNGFNLVGRQAAGTAILRDALQTGETRRGNLEGQEFKLLRDRGFERAELGHLASAIEQTKTVAARQLDPPTQVIDVRAVQNQLNNQTQPQQFGNPQPSQPFNNSQTTNRFETFLERHQVFQESQQTLGKATTDSQMKNTRDSIASISREFTPNTYSDRVKANAELALWQLEKSLDTRSGNATDRSVNALTVQKLLGTDINQWMSKIKPGANLSPSQKQVFGALEKLANEAKRDSTLSVNESTAPSIGIIRSATGRGALTDKETSDLRESFPESSLAAVNVSSLAASHAHQQLSVDHSRTQALDANAIGQ